MPTILPVAGDVRIHAVDGARYRFVPAGTFPMGATLNADEAPVHDVFLDAFWMMETEVTNALYRRCVVDGVCAPPNNNLWQDDAWADHPVTHVTWSQTTAYAEWAGGRLPTEAEWEKAARGIDGRMFPWGSELTNEEHLNFNSQGTTAVGTFAAGASLYGVLDMAGNVEEWVSDWYSPTYYGESPEQNPRGPEEGVKRVVRGGSFKSNRGGARAAVRAGAFPDWEFDNTGFRIVLPATEIQ